MLLSFCLGLVAVGDDEPKPPPDLFLAALEDFLVFFLEAFSLVRWDDASLLIC
jgi:hypothetical protein